MRHGVNVERGESCNFARQRVPWLDGSHGCTAMRVASVLMMCTLRNGQDGKLCVLYILSQLNVLKKQPGSKFLGPRVESLEANGLWV